LIDIVAAPELFETSKIPAAIIEQVRQKMMSEDNPVRPTKAKGKWQEIVRMNGTRFAVNCKKESGKIVMTGMRYAQRKKT
jgi:hypothetical protein